MSCVHDLALGTCPICDHEEIAKAAVYNEPALVREQVAPTPNNRAAIWPLVIADMHQRDVDGTAKYGTPLQAHNGRDPLIDAYQEALDLCVYLRQAIEERKSR